MKGQKNDQLREAAAYGLGLAIQDPHLFNPAMERVKDIVAGAAKEDQLALATMLKEAADSYAQKLSKPPEGEQPDKNLLVLVPYLDTLSAKDNDPKARLMAIAGLSVCPVGNACSRLLEIAKTEKDEPRNLAMEGLQTSASLGALKSLLEIMSGDKDPELAKRALLAFGKVRDEAQPADLIDKLNNDSDKVRMEIVKALGTKKKDAVAVKGLLQALGDKAPEIRVEVLKYTPDLNLNTLDLAKLEPLFTDSAQEVREALADAMSKMRDEPSWEMFFRAFEKIPAGPTRTLFLHAFGKRGMGHNMSKGKKDPRALAFAMKMLADSPGADIREVLAQLTVVPGKESREKERKDWGKQEWEGWYADEQKIWATMEETNTLFTFVDANKDNLRLGKMQGKPQLDKATALEDKLEETKKLCKDEEEANEMERLRESLGKVRYFLQKECRLDEKGK